MSGYTFANWRIALLAMTSVVLSIASGWTTWDGMSNFTSAPALSFLITFGIQSVLLISAWMLGEALVNRFRSTTSDRMFSSLLVVLAALLGLALLAGAVSGGQDPEFLSEHYVGLISSTGFWIGLLVAVAVVLAGLVYRWITQSVQRRNPTRALMNTAMLSLMFAACMATSVFFSFDSLFSSVFPDSERARASEIRAQSRVDGILNDLTGETQRASLTLQSRIVSGPIWTAYRSNIDKLRSQMEERAANLEKQAQALRDKSRESALALDQQRSLLQVRQERAADELAAANANLVALKEAMQRLRTERAERENKLRTLDEQIAAKTAAAEAELQGLGATAQRGRGPIYRTITADKRRLEIDKRRQVSELEILDEQIRRHSEKLTAAERDVEKRTVANAGASAQLRTVGQTPQATSLTDNEAQRAALLAASNKLEQSRIAFEQTFAGGALATLEKDCATGVELLGVHTSETGSTPVSCTASDVRVAIAPVHAMRDGVALVNERCKGEGTGSDGQPAGSIDQLVNHARECVQLAALPAELSATLRRRIDDLQRNRDDLAHRFIVTMNAFSDGNRLAYLALAIALCIDFLVFIAGLLGAATRSSPFTSLPNALGHTVAGADRIMRSALFPNLPRTAQAALSAVRPVSGAQANQGIEGWTHQIALDDRKLGGRAELSRIVNAAASIGAAQRVAGNRDLYRLRREVVDFLALHTIDPDWQKKHEPQPRERARLVEALGEDPRKVAVITSAYLRPAEPDGDFTLALSLDDVDNADKATVTRALAAAAIAKEALPAGNGAPTGHYRIHRDFAETLLELTRGREENAGASGASDGGLEKIEAEEHAPPQTASKDTVQPAVTQTATHDRAVFDRATASEPSTPVIPSNQSVEAKPVVLPIQPAKPNVANEHHTKTPTEGQLNNPETVAERKDKAGQELGSYIQWVMRE